MCVEKQRFGEDLARGDEDRRFCRRSAVEGQCYTVFQKKHNRTKSRGGHGADAPQTDMDQRTAFLGLGLLRMRVDVQAVRAARWRIH